MAGKIPQPFIDQVLNQTDIVDLINGYVELKNKGREFTACCPFHGEKTPSFTVSPEKQFYHCFGCGAHGTAINFLMEHEGLQFIEAIEVLANRLGLEVTTEEGNAPRSDNHKLYEALEEANKYYQNQLRINQDAISYLKSRGISGEIASMFNIGFAPTGFNNISKAFSNNFGQACLVNTGLLSEKSEKKTYDRFRSRIMFPIKDTRGRTIGFGGRSVDDTMPKYMNSPETELFHKGNTLYGIYEARKSLGKLNQLIIVEGYMDVVALSQHNIKNCVATLGTATTTQNIRNLLRFSSDLIFCFDGDRAGRDAAWKALDQMLPEYKDGINIRFAFMPQGDDPDSLIRSLGKDAFNDYLNNAASLSEYFFTNLIKDIDTSTPDGRAKLASTAKPLLAKIPPTVFRDLMYKELNERVGTTIPVASSIINHTIQSASNANKQNRSLKYTKTRLAVALLIRDPSLAKNALPTEELSNLLSVPGISLLIQLLEIINADPNISPIALVERFHDQNDYGSLQKLLLWDPPDMENRELSFKQTMDRFKEDIRRNELDSIIQSENL
ncbi:MAG: DNA primase [Gammaproteobacteria bacterium]|nr:DNA primase [Gammaproteobacteria bacterium]